MHRRAPLWLFALAAPLVVAQAVYDITIPPLEEWDDDPIAAAGDFDAAMPPADMAYLSEDPLANVTYELPPPPPAPTPRATPTPSPPPAPTPSPTPVEESRGIPTAGAIAAVSCIVAAVWLRRARREG